jgi:hypothetical protein
VAAAAAPVARGSSQVTLGGGLDVLGKGSSSAPVQGRGGTEDSLTDGGAGSVGKESRRGGAGKKWRCSE